MLGYISIQQESHHPSSLKHQTSSDCTGGRMGDAVRYCQSEQRYILKLSIINME